MKMTQDEKYMKAAIREAKKAYALDEVPVRLMVIRSQGGNYLSPDEIPELLDPELPQQLLVSAFRKYSK